MSAPPPQPPTSSSSSSKTQPPPPPQQPSSSTNLSASSITIPSDSENYDGNNEFSSSSGPSDDASPPESAPSSPLQQSQPQSQSPVVLYTPPTLWTLFRGVAINLFLPFVNGLMLGFGELFAHEIAFRLGWSGTKIFPSYRTSRSVGPGVELQDDPVERRKRSGQELDMYTSLE